MGSPEGFIRRESVPSGAFEHMWFMHPILKEGAKDGMHPCRADKDMRSPYDGRDVKAGEPLFMSQCAARLSLALARIGVKIPEHDSMCRVPYPNGQVCYTRTSTMAQDIPTLGIPGLVKKPLRFSGSECRDFMKHIIGKRGVIYIKNFYREEKSGDSGSHIDLWWNGSTPGKPLIQSYATSGLRSNYSLAEEIVFWEIK
jgi:hypothetical protein